MQDQLGAAPEALSVVAFWREAGPGKWFTKSDAFDQAFRDRFLGLHMAAARRELDGWADGAEGGLALLILLDQFPRNAFRGTGHMYAADGLALHFARRMVDAGLDQEIPPDLRGFCYLPFMHSERLDAQERSVALYRVLGGPSLPFAEDHLDIIRRFGRFPHRNPMLGRETTAAERAFIDAGGFAG
ncbi:DUF924 family protein [Parapusillimonas granuli]|uniref:DUF924 family protein n=1 Tax=Parapusillimonas granuli TaxID=380911 RepID=A0A853FWK9_9BURK|nr:DUF924 family protein [Parapusillimonas granuli]MBB5213700.1 uncharacterized protein (DUF924 family) [Parapusillimonas granuli]NYT48537.1 DUF924 family protein [Parapusillimonas granuli]